MGSACSIGWLWSNGVSTEPGQTATDPDIVFPHFEHEGAAEAQHRVLGRGVGGAAHEPVPSGQARHVDDGSLPPPAHRGKHRPGHEKETADVRRHGGVPVLHRELVERASDEHAGVVHQDADFTDRHGDLVGGSLRLGRIADVGADTGGVDALALQAGDELVHASAGPRADADAVAGAPKGECRRATNALRGAGDECGGGWGHGGN